MSKAWMPMYVGDYLADTQHLSTLEHGMYHLLIYHYWEHGGLPTDPTSLSILVKTSRQTWARHAAKISALFQQPGWRHKRIDAELAKYKKIRNARKIAGAIGGTRTQVVRHLRLASAQAFASMLPQANAQANALPITEEREEREKKRVAEEASKQAVVQPEPSLTASPYLAAVLQAKGWVR